MMQRFEPKTESKVISHLAKILIIPENPLEESVAINQEIAVMDPSNVLMVVAKSIEAKRVLSRFKDSGNNDKEPTMEYNKESENGSRYSTLYLKRSIDLLNIMFESVDIKVANDYPITLENPHFKIIIAPRMRNEEWVIN